MVLTLAPGLLSAVAPTVLAASWQALPDDVVPVVSTGVGAFVLLGVEVPLAWSGPPDLRLAAAGENGQHAIVVADAVGLPLPLEAWRGRVVSVDRQDRSLPFSPVPGTATCTATVSALEVVSRASWMEGFSFWAAAPGCRMAGAEPGSPTALSEGCREAQIAEVASFSERLLVGRLTACEGDGFAVAYGERPSEGPSDRAAAPVQLAWRQALAVDDPLHAGAHARLRETPAWLATQARWIQTRTDDDWQEWQGAPSVARYTAGKRTWVVMTEHDGGCGAFEASFWLAWEVSGPRGLKWTPVPTVDALPFFNADVAVVNSIGVLPIFLNGWGIYSSHPSAIAPMIQSTAEFKVPWMGCAC
ncbi:MAG: hypothetical protein EXR69_12040 [Myxococcales bacterium]|nr:hypothetical protein [Myxococcales bacterium]